MHFFKLLILDNHFYSCQNTQKITPMHVAQYLWTWAALSTKCKSWCRHETCRCTWVLGKHCRGAIHVW